MNMQRAHDIECAAVTAPIAGMMKASTCAAPRPCVARFAAWAVTLCALCLWCAGCGAPDLEKTGLVKITDCVYAYVAVGPAAAEGLGANSGFVVGEDGVLVVDSRYTPALARELLGAIRSVTDAPIRYLVNTHYHPDHTWGNSVFKEEGAVIISHPRTRADIEEYSPLYLEHYRTNRKEAYELLKDVAVVLPDTTFEDELSIDLGGVRVVLRHFGPGHTAGDCVVFVPRDGVVFTGGLTADRYHLNLGDNGADFDNWAATLLRLSGMDLRYVVPSQGMVAGPDLLTTCRDYIETLRRQCREEIRAGGYVNAVALTMKIPGTEGYLQDNLLPYNVRAVYLSEIVKVLEPNFRLDLPDGFEISDGGAAGKGGRIKWASNTADGELEIEVHWSPTARSELLVQDVKDRVLRYVDANKGVLSMEIVGTKTLDIGGADEPAAFGTHRITTGTTVVSTGIWTWCMLIRDGNLYSIQLQTDAQRVPERERRNMEILERIAGTFRLTAGG
jgi:glyoxylase-like metal-dependent hydrolase (beta-lactamase superfamily II)